MPFTRQSDLRRLRLLTGILLLHLLAVAVLSVAPDLHALLHGHAHDEAHVCAVTLFRGGAMDVVATDIPVATALRWTRLPAMMPVESAAASLALMGKPGERGPPGESVASI